MDNSNSNSNNTSVDKITKTYIINNIEYTKEQIKSDPELIKELYKLLQYQQHKEKSKIRMREQRQKDPEGYKQKQREYHYNKYHNDAAYRERTLQRFKDKQAQKDALLFPNMKKPR